MPDGLMAGDAMREARAHDTAEDITNCRGL